MVQTNEVLVDIQLIINPPIDIWDSVLKINNNQLEFHQEEYMAREFLQMIPTLSANSQVEEECDEMAIKLLCVLTVVSQNEETRVAELRHSMDCNVETCNEYLCNMMQAVHDHRDLKKQQHAQCLVEVLYTSVVDIIRINKS